MHLYLGGGGGGCTHTIAMLHVAKLHVADIVHTQHDWSDTKLIHSTIVPEPYLCVINECV